MEGHSIFIWRVAQSEWIKQGWCNMSNIWRWAVWTTSNCNSWNLPHSPSPVTTSPLLKLFLGTRTFHSILLNSSKPLKNKGLMSPSLSLILFIFSGSTVGEGKVNAWKPGKKLKMLSATFWPSWATADESCTLKTYRWNKAIALALSINTNLKGGKRLTWRETRLDHFNNYMWFLFYGWLAFCKFSFFRVNNYWLRTSVISC